MPIKHQNQGAQVVVAAAAIVRGPGSLLVPEQEVDQSAVIVAADLPVADPHVKNQLWSNAGVVTISAG